MSDRNEDIARIGSAMARMRLMIGRRYIGRVAIKRLASGMELSQLDVLGLVRRLSQTQEVTVGTIADQMRIDHSRASRIVADLVRSGKFRRDVSQEDARRTVVSLTPEGRKLVSEVHEVKHELLNEALSDWSEDDIATFASLYHRFMVRMDEQANAFDQSLDAEDAEGAVSA